MSDNNGYTISVSGDEVSILKDGEVVSIWSPTKQTFATADGSIYVPQKAANLQPELKAYASGEYVEVLKAGDWLPGRISSKQPGILNVDTERGPVTVGSALRIRKVAKA